MSHVWVVVNWELGMPIVRSVSGKGTFEGADAMWIRPDCAIIGRGLRTNDEGRQQVTEILLEPHPYH